MKKTALTIIVLTFISSCSYGQRVNEYYYQKENPAYKIYFYSDGTFMEFAVNWTDRVCSLGENISKGTYSRKAFSYILNSDDDWALPDTTYLNTNTAAPLTTESDSLTIVADSYYERMFKQEEENGMCSYPHHRIYLYTIRLHCGNDSVNQTFEERFNEQHIADSIGYWCVPCPPEIEIHSIEITMFWNETSSSDITHCSAYRVFSHIPENIHQRSFVLVFPDQVDYFLLTRKAYRNQKIRRLSSKAIVLDGKIYKKMKY